MPESLGIPKTQLTAEPKAGRKTWLPGVCRHTVARPSPLPGRAAFSNSPSSIPRVSNSPPINRPPHFTLPTTPVVFDNSTLHRAECLRVPDNILLLFFRPYRTDLNPTERLWQHLKSPLAGTFSPSSSNSRAGLPRCFVPPLWPRFTSSLFISISRPP